jgi:predicted transposase/invertase (TIGR01784 family)
LLLGIVDHRNGEIYEDIYKELEEIAMKDEKLKNAFQGWDVLSATHEDVLAYEARLKQVLDEEAARIEAELREKEAHEKGLEEGIEKGIEKGGTVEKFTIAKRMLKEGLEVKVVAKFTELTTEQVQKIKKEL